MCKLCKTQGARYLALNCLRSVEQTAKPPQQRTALHQHGIYLAHIAQTPLPLSADRLHVTSLVKLLSVGVYGEQYSI